MGSLSSQYSLLVATRTAISSNMSIKGTALDKLFRRGTFCRRTTY
jgi:hypothetical protein